MFLKFERKSRYFFFILKSKSFQFFCKATKERLIEIAADGKISNDEIDDFIHIRQELERISLTVETLQLWTERMLANGQIDAETYKRKLEE